MTTNRARAGRPFEQQPMGLRRVDASQIKDGRAVVVPGKYESSPLPYTDITPAWHIKAWDFAGRVLDYAIDHLWVGGVLLIAGVALLIWSTT